jgi:hypothetical protein
MAGRRQETPVRPAARITPLTPVKALAAAEPRMKPFRRKT